MIRTFPVLAFLLGLAATASPARAAEDADTPPPPVNMTLHAGLDGPKLTVEGDCSVPNGALIIYVAYLPKTPAKRIQGYAMVNHGHYKATIDVGAWPAGEIKVDADFQVYLQGLKQPDEVIALYGEKGERMTGPQVVQGGASFRAAATSTSVIKP